MSRYSIQGPHYPFAISPLTGADPGFEKGGIWGKIFWHILPNLGGFLMKLAQKGVGVRPLRPPLDPPLIEYKRKDLVIRY